MWPILTPLIFLLLAATLVFFLERYGRKRMHQGSYDALVIPGAKVHSNGMASDAVHRRAKMAAKLYKQGIAPQIVCTGGKPQAGITEAAAIAQILIANGVPEYAILLEQESSSTEENARFTAQKISTTRILIVSDTYHIWRCERVFRKYFADAVGIGAVPRRHWQMSLRELGAILIYAVQGHLSPPATTSFGQLIEQIRLEIPPLLKLAIPVVVGQLGLMAMGVVDMIMVGHVSEQALGAVALGHTWSFGTSIVAMGVAMGLDPLIAQAFGAKDRLAAGRAFSQGIPLIAALCIPVMVAHVFAESGLRWLGQPEELVVLAGGYCKILALGVPPFLFFGLIRQFLQGDGRMQAATWAIVVANLLNVLANYVLIHGYWGFPALGALGSAWATLISRYVMVGILFGSGFGLIRECWPGIRVWFDFRGLLRLAWHGLPVGFQLGLEIWAFNAATIFMGWFDKTAVGAHAIVLNLCAIAFMVPMGISAAAATRVGNKLGAGESWRGAAWASVSLGAAAMTMAASTYISFRPWLIHAYSKEPAVIDIAMQLLPWGAAFAIFDGIQVVCFGVLRGAGDAKLPALANLIGYWFIGLPIGYWLAFHRHWGPQGIWVGLVIGLAIVAGLLIVRQRSTIARGGFHVVSNPKLSG